MQIGDLYLSNDDLIVVTDENASLGVNQYNEKVSIPSDASLILNYKQIIESFRGAICQQVK